MGGEKLFTII